MVLERKSRVFGGKGEESALVTYTPGSLSAI